MLHLVPLFKHMVILKSIIATEVNNLGLTASQLLAYLHSMAMRQSNKNHITCCCNSIQLLHRLQILFNASRQMRIHRSNRLSRTAFRGNHGNFRFRMSIQKSQKLNSCIACCTDNTCFHIHPPLYSIIIQLNCIILQALCEFFCKI